MALDLTQFSDFTPPEMAITENIFLPDGIIQPVADVVVQFVRQYPLSFQPHEIITTQLAGYSLSIDQTMRYIRQHCAALGGIFIDRFPQTEQMAIAESNNGVSSGSCPYQWLNFKYNGTVSDPIILAHELGHWFGYNGGDPRVRHEAEARDSLAEIQAFFFQNLITDALAASPLAHGVKLYQEFEKRNCLGGFNWGIQNIEDLKASGDLRQLYGYIHGHSMGAILGAGFYERYKSTNKDKKSEMLDVLYRRGTQVDLTELCKVFSIRDQRDLTSMAKEFCKAVVPDVAHHANDFRLNPIN